MFSDDNPIDVGFFSDTPVATLAHQMRVGAGATPPNINLSTFDGGNRHSPTMGAPSCLLQSAD